MMMDRRSLLAALGWLTAGPVFAQDAPSPLAAYESKTGGRIGVYAENLATGKTLGWRAGERFVMCSTFKASLAACVLTRVDRGQDRLDKIVADSIAPRTERTFSRRRHCEERSDEAIQTISAVTVWIASLRSQ